MESGVILKLKMEVEAKAKKKKRIPQLQFIRIPGNMF